jgi:hypothetical protein
MIVTAFWDMTPFSLVEEYRLFRQTCCRHLHSTSYLEDGGTLFVRNHVSLRSSKAHFAKVRGTLLCRPFGEK